MRRLVRPILMAALTVATQSAISGISTGASAAAPATNCPVGGYTSTAVKCVTVPASGRFSIRVPGTHVKLIGTGSASTQGTVIALTKVPDPVSTPKGVGLKVQARGKFKPLHLNKGKLDFYNHAVARVQKVKAVTRSGVYVVVP